MYGTEGCDLGGFDLPCISCSSVVVHQVRVIKGSSVDCCIPCCTSYWHCLHVEIVVPPLCIYFNIFISDHCTMTCLYHYTCSDCCMYYHCLCVQIVVVPPLSACSDHHCTTILLCSDGCATTVCVGI